MLLAVEGGGFFSSSASGYSKGLTLLFLGQKNNEEKLPMRVTPWNQYQLVEGEPDPDLQVDSGKGCVSFVCFGGAAAGPESPSPLKAGQQEVVVPQSLVSDDGMSREEIHSASDGATNTKCNPKVTTTTLRSSLKKPSKTITVNADDKDSDDRKALNGEECEVSADEAQRKVQWTDTDGGELFDVREFEPSEDNGSDDDDLNGGAGKTCSCNIM